VRFEAWLLGLSEPGSAADRFLHEIGADIARPDDVAGVAAAIRRRYEEYRQGARPGRRVVEECFSRRAQARILFDAISRCCLPGDHQVRCVEPTGAKQLHT
jgi:hypothetical protein